MKVLFYDTETTDLPLFEQPSSDPRQPHLVQVAAALVDVVAGHDIASFNLLVRPDGWESTPEALAVHGITTEHANANGVPEYLVVRVLLDLWRAADVRVGHAESFDARMMRIALKRFASDEIADQWKAGAAECTHKQAKALIPDLPKAGGGSLRAVYRHFFGTDFDNAHSAEADMRACQLIWEQMRRA